MDFRQFKLCWNCGRKFWGNHRAIIVTPNGLCAVHKECVEDYKVFKLLPEKEEAKDG